MILTKLYTVIYVVLFASATVQVLAGFTGPSYWLVFGVTMVPSTTKAMLVVTYLQHLRFEPRSLAYLVCAGLVAVLALTFVASYSLP